MRAGTANPDRTETGEPTEIRVGELIALGIDGGQGMRWYHSQVQDLTSDLLQVAMPMERLRVVQAKRGAPCGVLFTKEGDARYILRTTIQQIVAGELPSLWIARRGTWRRIQDRNDVRVAYTILSPRCCRLQPDKEATRPLVLRVVVQDLSASGIQFWSQDEVKIGDEVSFGLDLPGSTGTVEAVAEVVRLDQRSGNQFAWRAGARFRDLGAREREQIIRFVFEQQREQLRRGLKPR